MEVTLRFKKEGFYSWNDRYVTINLEGDGEEVTSTTIELRERFREWNET